MYYAIAGIVLAVVGIVLYIRKRKESNEMPQGLQVYDANGNTVIDSSSLTTVFLGIGNTGTTSGSITVPNTNGKQLWVMPVNRGGNPPLTTREAMYVTPTFYISSNVISWVVEPTFLSSSQYKVIASDFIYGVF